MGGAGGFGWGCDGASAGMKRYSAGGEHSNFGARDVSVGRPGGAVGSKGVFQK